uniref:Uncharacterized protein n=1 Tax=Alexandrium andersonii TaxID=327968 RepID=A0A7S2AVI8_9DINO|mmetsp:Transcript_1887/g.4154  ORF Transcript_1887/g.4154 Transcript_1887/m.4154 type:complete len:382 (+) Transcript_1887:160-1305(+)
MAKKALAVGLFLLSTSMVVTLISLFLPFHKLSIATAGFLDAVEFTTYVIRMHITMHDTTFCKALEVAVRRRGFCKNMQGTHDLEEVTQIFCSAGSKVVVKNACSGTYFAYTVGVCIVLAAVVNFILDGFAARTLYDYLTKAPRKKKRVMAVALSAVSSVIIVVPLLAYVPLALLQMDYIDFRISVASWIVGKSRDMGTRKGYIGMWFGILLKVVSIGLIYRGRSGSEEASEERQFMTEMQLYHQQVGLAAPPVQNLPLQFGGPGAAPSRPECQRPQVSPGQGPVSQVGTRPPLHQQESVSQGLYPGAHQHNANHHSGQQFAGGGAPFGRQASFTVGPYGGHAIAREVSMAPRQWGSPWGMTWGTAQVGDQPRPGISWPRWG